jgi:hypothetical protein
MMDRYDRAIAAVHAAAPADEESIRLGELSALVEAALGEPLDRATFSKLAKIQEDLRASTLALNEKLDSGELTPEAYLDRSDEALREAMKLSWALLGKARFMKIFGEAGLHPEGLADREAFLAQYRDAASR